MIIFRSRDTVAVRVRTSSRSIVIVATGKLQATFYGAIRIFPARWIGLLKLKESNKELSLDANILIFRADNVDK